MNIDVYTCTFNEEELMPYFLRHYRSARNIIIYDNESTDRTKEIALRDPRVIIREWSTGGFANDEMLTQLKNSCWNGSDADYVVIVDTDEFVDLRPLERYGVAEVAFKCEGRQMIGIDGQPIDEINRYHLNSGEDKVAVFSPKIAKLNMGIGGHKSNPTCPVITDPRLVLRHYTLCGCEFNKRRLRKPHPLCKKNIKMQWGIQVTFSDKVIEEGHANALLAATNIDVDIPW